MDDAINAKNAMNANHFAAAGKLDSPTGGGKPSHARERESR
jgi:hypothetical protein